MYAVLAFWPIWAKARHVELAELPPNMAFAASWAFVAEAFVVVFAHG
jgi:hypothetical protein